MSQSANDKFLAELRLMREAVLHAQGQLRRGAPLSRALDTLLIDMDDIAFIVTGLDKQIGIARDPQEE